MKRKPPPSKAAPLCVIGVVAGLALVIVAHALPLWLGGERSISQEDAQRYTEAHARLHAIAAGGGSPESQEWRRAQDEIDQQRRRLEDSEAQVLRLSWVLWGAGAAITVVGVAAYLIAKPD